MSISLNCQSCKLHSTQCKQIFEQCICIVCTSVVPNCLLIIITNGPLHNQIKNNRVHYRNNACIKVNKFTLSRWKAYKNSFIRTTKSNLETGQQYVGGPPFNETKPTNVSMSLKLATIWIFYWNKSHIILWPDYKSSLAYIVICITMTAIVIFFLCSTPLNLASYNYLIWMIAF